jgi:uncharacterized metal-binding protein YceD (DUF177 family)
MTADTAFPWSVPVRLDEIGKHFKRHLAPDEAQRAAIADLADLEALPALEADIEVIPSAMGGEIRGHFDARVVQICGVSLEPFETAIAADFIVPFTTEPPVEEPDVEEAEFNLADLEGPDLIESGVLDLGAYVTEHLMLELDPFPRKPDVEFEAPAADVEPSPFAVLAKLKPGGEGGA